MIRTLMLDTDGAGLYDITHRVAKVIAGSDRNDGLVTLYIRHTSASLLIQENADPSVREDIRNWFDRLVPEGDALYTHVAEGPDDMPAHLKAALTQVSLAVPILDGELALGTWQGIYLFEHRHRPHQREVLVHVA